MRGPWETDDKDINGGPLLLYPSNSHQITAV